MIKKYWISKWTREWGIIEEESGQKRNVRYSTPWTSDIPKSRDLLARLEDAGFVLLDRIEFLLLSKALDERGEPLSFSPFPPDSPAGLAVIEPPRPWRPLESWSGAPVPAAA